MLGNPKEFQGGIQGESLKKTQEGSMNESRERMSNEVHKISGEINEEIPEQNCREESRSRIPEGIHDENSGEIYEKFPGGIPKDVIKVINEITPE